jgi:ubiquinone biosynthesis protein UbiJ
LLARPSLCSARPPLAEAQAQRIADLEWQAAELAEVKRQMAQLAETLARLDRAARDQGT